MDGDDTIGRVESESFSWRKAFLFRGKTCLFILATTLFFAAACDDDPNRPAPFEEREVGVVVNSVELSLTIFPVDDPSSTLTVGLAPEGSPVGLALRNGVAAVPMGIFPAVVVVDVAEGTVLRTVGLPENSGATGAAFLNDSILLVSNPQLNTVSPVNIRAGTLGDPVETGGHPQNIIVQDGKAFILNAELGNDFQPERSGTVTVLDAGTLEVLNTIDLTGENPSGVATRDGTLYIVNSGRYSEGDGSLSVVDPASEAEIGHHEGFGDFPGAIAAGPGGRLHVTSFSYGLSVWDPSSSAFVRSPEDAVAPGEVPAASGLGFDSEGRLYVLTPECQESARAYRLSESFEDEVDIAVGICPLAIGFTRIEVETDAD